MRTLPTLTLLLLAPALVVAWLLAPAQLGGRTHYAVIEGTSMEPKLHRGDLVLIRERPSYAVGDVVAFASSSLGATVLHRIVEREGRGFVTKGDNNDFLDADRPLPADVKGALWLRLPKAGLALGWAREPAHAALVGGLAALLAAGGGAGAGARRRGRRLPLPSGDVFLVVAAVGFLAGAAAFTRPTTRAGSETAYRHTATFSYAARAAAGSAVYGTSSLGTGQPLYLALVGEADVAFRYRLHAERPHAVGGRIGLRALLRGPDGWTRTLTLAAPRPFRGDAADVSATLDLRRLTALTREVGEVTGTPNATYTLVVKPSVRLDGVVGERRVGDGFSPELAFQLSPTALQLQSDPTTGRPAQELRPQRDVTATTTEPNALTLAGLTVPVRTARVLAIVLLAAGALGFAAAALGRRRSGDGELAEIERLLGDRLVAVTELAPTVRIAELASVGALVRVAESYDRVVLHLRHELGEVFAVDEDGVSHRYRVGDALDGLDEPIARLRLDASVRQ